METNYCLYCEKRLADESLAFCSLSCQSNEASKEEDIMNDLCYHRRPSFTFRPYPSLSSTSSVLSSLSDLSIYSCDDKAYYSVTRIHPTTPTTATATVTATRTLF
ncbi:hypothetical protein BY458DRAFT_520035 [Sporodiniella umbellata]|nr:hypothetical protein BY458DRAFT_520035 [Sporodiniella umbellata]